MIIGGSSPISSLVPTLQSAQGNSNWSSPKMAHWYQCCPMPSQRPWQPQASLPEFPQRTLFTMAHKGQYQFHTSTMNIAATDPTLVCKSVRMAQSRNFVSWSDGSFFSTRIYILRQNAWRSATIFLQKTHKTDQDNNP